MKLGKDQWICSICSLRVFMKTYLGNVGEFCSSVEMGSGKQLHSVLKVSLIVAVSKLEL